MNIAETIIHIYPNLVYGVDFILKNNGISSDVEIIWFNTEFTEPTQAELDSAWIELQQIQLKQKDIKAFCDAYNLVTNISYKLASCNENINKQGCTAANKELIQMQIDDFEIKLTAAETDRDTLLLAGVTEYTDGSNAQRLALVQEFNDALIGNT